MPQVTLLFFSPLYSMTCECVCVCVCVCEGAPVHLSSVFKCGLHCLFSIHTFSNSRPLVQGLQLFGAALSAAGQKRPHAVAVCLRGDYIKEAAAAGAEEEKDSVCASWRGVLTQGGLKQCSVREEWGWTAGVLNMGLSSLGHSISHYTGRSGSEGTFLLHHIIRKTPLSCTQWPATIRSRVLCVGQDDQCF